MRLTWYQKIIGWWLIIAPIMALTAFNCWLIFGHTDKFRAAAVPVNVSVPATPAPEVKKAAKVNKPIKSRNVKVYPDTVKSVLNLPPEVIKTPELDVIASTQVPADIRPRTITTLMNTDTGESQVYVKRDEYPWLAWDTHGEIGLIAGFKNGQPAVRLQARQGVMQVKALHLGLAGSVDQPLSGPQGVDYMVGGTAWIEW